MSKDNKHKDKKTNRSVKAVKRVGRTKKKKVSKSNRFGYHHFLKITRKYYRNKFDSDTSLVSWVGYHWINLKDQVEPINTRSGVKEVPFRVTKQVVTELLRSEGKIKRVKPRGYKREDDLKIPDSVFEFFDYYDDFKFKDKVQLIPSNVLICSKEFGRFNGGDVSKELIDKYRDLVRHLNSFKKDRDSKDAFQCSFSKPYEEGNLGNWRIDFNVLTESGVKIDFRYITEDDNAVLDGKDKGDVVDVSDKPIDVPVKYSEAVLLEMERTKQAVELTKQKELDIERLKLELELEKLKRSK